MDDWLDWGPDLVSSTDESLVKVWHRWWCLQTTFCRAQTDFFIQGFKSTSPSSMSSDTPRDVRAHLVDFHPPRAPRIGRWAQVWPGLRWKRDDAHGVVCPPHGLRGRRWVAIQHHGQRLKFPPCLPLRLAPQLRPECVHWSPCSSPLHTSTPPLPRPRSRCSL